MVSGHIFCHIRSPFQVNKSEGNRRPIAVSYQICSCSHFQVPATTYMNKHARVGYFVVKKLGAKYFLIVV